MYLSTYSEPDIIYIVNRRELVALFDKITGKCRLCMQLLTYSSWIRWSPQLPRYQRCNLGKARNYFLGRSRRSVRLKFKLFIIKQESFYHAFLYRKALWLNGYVISGRALWVYAASLLFAIVKYMRVICGCLVKQVAVLISFRMFF